MTYHHHWILHMLQWVQPKLPVSIPIILIECMTGQWQ